MEAGFPAGVVQNMFIDNATAEYVIRHKAIKAVTLTGSTRAGAQVSQVAASVIKKCVLELGGCDPFIVLKDADMDVAVEQAVQGRLQNALRPLFYL